jgi:enediyne biosynthesis protein E5
LSAPGTDLRLPALRRFAVAITVLNLLGHTLLGFEQSWAQPLVGAFTAYAVELLLELIDARLNARAPRFVGGWRRAVEFLLPAHITGLAAAMLLYSNSRLGPIAFAAGAAVASKYVLRVPSGSRHLFNPSNLGITLTLLAFPWVSIVPPYQYTENLTGALDWALPVVVVVSGSFLNWRFTRKLPLIAAWLAGFTAQALIRSAWLGASWRGALMPMTGMAFLLYTFYMVTDPATTPRSVRGQLGFGLLVASLYGLLTAGHVVFGVFFALSIASSLRGLALAASAYASRTPTWSPVPAGLPIDSSDPVRASGPTG